MALSAATITYDLSDYSLADFDSRRTKVWATNNVSGPVVDTEGNTIHLGSANGTVNADGTGSITVPTPGTGSNPASWQTTIHVDYPDRNADRGRGSKSFGPFTITVSINLADLIEEQAVPPEYAGAIVAEMEALRDETAAISGLTGEDAAVALLIDTPASDTATALSATIERGAGIVSARANGVTADGTTDDTAALQAVINAVAAFGGGAVMLPRGTTLVSAEITVPEHVWITGEAPGGWENYGQENAGTTIRLANSSGLTATQGVVRFIYEGALTSERRHQGGMVGVAIDGNRTTNTANSGVVMAGVRFVHFERVHVFRCGLHGFSSVTDVTATSEMSFVGTFSGFNGGSGYRLYGGDSTINGAMAGVNDGDGFYLGLAATVCTGLSSWNNKRDGLIVASTTATQFLSIVGGQFYDNDRAGITVEAPGANAMLGNSIVGASCHGNGRQEFTAYPNVYDRVGIRVLGAHTVDTLSIRGVSTGNRTYTLPNEFQQYGVALLTPGCVIEASGVVGDNAVALWYYDNATAYYVQSGAKFNDITPALDNTFDVGQSGKRVRSVGALRHAVYLAANDTQIRAALGSLAGGASIEFGPGGTTAPDWIMSRSAADTMALGAGDSLAVDGTWNGGTYRLGAYRLWIDATGALRVKSGAPTSDTDGAVVGTQSLAPGTVGAVTVTASPMSVTVGTRPEQYYVIGGTWTSIQIGGQTIHAGNLGTTTFTFDAQPGDALTFTYSVAPTAIKKRAL